MLSNHPNCLGGNGPSASSDLIGDVDGPASATDNAVARFDGTTGKLIQNSAVTIDDSGNITPTGSVHAAAGSVGNPSLAFNVDQNTGLYNIGPNNIGVAANGAKVLDIATTGLTVTGALGASSLTSPAGNNLTLGTGTGGTALTLASSTLAATFAGSITTSNGSLVLTGTPVIYFGAPSSNYLFYNGSTLATRLGGTDRMIINGTTGDVSLSSTTAGASNAGALVVTGGLSAGAASYFGGAVTVEKSLNSDFASLIANANAGAAAQTSLYISNGTTAAESTFISTNGTGLTTVGGFIQDGGAIGSGTSLSGGLSIMARAASSDIRFYAGSHTNLVATFASTGAATFAGAVTAGGTIKAGAGSGETLSAGSVDVAKDIGIASTQGIVQGGVRIVTFTSGAATFAGAVTTGALTVSSANLILSAGYELRFGAGGADRIYQSAASGGTLVFDTGSVTRFTLNSTAATFSGAVTVTGALKLGNAYVAGAVVGTGSITIQDSTGTTYRIPVLV